MQFPKTPKNPLYSLPFFTDPEDPYVFQTFMFQVFRNLAVSQAEQVGSLSKEVLSWILQEWWTAIDKALTEHNQKSDKCSVEVSSEVAAFTGRLLMEMNPTRRRKVELVPEPEKLHEELRKNGLTPKAPIPKEQINPLKPAEILDTNVPQKERRKKPQL